MNKIAIRVDANEIVATGHVMRCRTIANSLAQMGCSVVFVSADNNIIPYIGENFDYRILGSDWRELDAEVSVLIDFLKSEDIGRILLDTYYATPLYIRTLREAGIKVMYIDDMQKEVYPANAILNYSPGAPELNYEKMYENEGSMLLLGTDYIPLREQFWNRADSVRPKEFTVGTVLGTDGEALQNIDIIAMENKESSEGAHRTYGYEKKGINNIFLTTGGADSMGLSDYITTAIIRDPELKFKEPGKKIHLLAGRFYRVSERVQQHIEDGYVILHQNVDNVADIMEMCDAGITPAGTTLFELCALGIPCVSYVFVENQEPDAAYFNKENLVPYAGDFREDEKEVMENILKILRSLGKMDSAERIEEGEKLKRAIDGQGAERIAEAILDM